MISYQTGDLLEADVEALVNTVNTVGVMGKGVALQFSRAFPETVKPYQKACKRGELRLGQVLTVPTANLGRNPKFIIHFPTKGHWKELSSLEHIRAGLQSLVEEIRRLEISSIALPPLGCGQGGLNWTDVRPVIAEALGSIKNLSVLVFEPEPQPVLHTVAAGPKPKLTPAKAILVELFERYHFPGEPFGRTEASKLAYFLQASGITELQLQFEKQSFGPFAQKLNYVLKDMDGHYITGLGDLNAPSEIQVIPGVLEDAHRVLQNHSETQKRLERVSELVFGFDDPYGMELLSSIHWLVTKENAQTPDEARILLWKWNGRKRRIFHDESHILIAYDHLKHLGWFDLEQASVQRPQTNGQKRYQKKKQKQIENLLNKLT